MLVRKVVRTPPSRSRTASSNREPKRRSCRTLLLRTLLLWASIGYGTAWCAESKDADHSAPAHPIAIAIGETLRDFIHRNAIGTGRPGEPRDIAIELDTIPDASPVIIEHRIALTLEDGGQGFTIDTPGHALNISQSAGVIDGFAFTLFDEPKPFELAIDGIRTVLRKALALGWAPQVAIALPTDPAVVSASSGWDIVAQLTDKANNTLELKIVDYGRAPKSESWIVWPLGRSSQASHDFLVQVAIVGHALGAKWSDTIEPRRLFVNGDRYKSLPLRVWVDDPAWRPATAGMVPTSPEKRAADPRAGAWTMPPTK